MYKILLRLIVEMVQEVLKILKRVQKVINVLLVVQDIKIMLAPS